MRTEPTRLAFIDALKAIASQLIVLHHLAFYGPMSDVANELAPALFSWLSQDARIAVQVFLVIGGVLAAKALAPAGQLIDVAPLALLIHPDHTAVLPEMLYWIEEIWRQDRPAIYNRIGCGFGWIGLASAVH